MQLNHKKLTPFYYALKSCSKEMTELLISNGANINAKDIIYQNSLIIYLITGILKSFKRDG